MRVCAISRLGFEVVANRGGILPLGRSEASASLTPSGWTHEKSRSVPHNLVLDHKPAAKVVQRTAFYSALPPKTGPSSKPLTH
jgi:hypothetical protein